MRRKPVVSMMAAAIFTVVLLSGQPAEAGLFDKLSKKFTSCYKSFEKKEKACKSYEKKAKKFHEMEVKLTETKGDELFKKYESIEGDIMPEDFQKEVDSYETKINQLQRDANDNRENYVKCLEEAKEYLLKCRLEKKEFKKGCDEKKMEDELKMIEGNVIKVQGDLDECMDKCDEINDKNEAKLREAGKQGKRFGAKKLEKLIQDIKQITQTCKSKCYNTRDSNKWNDPAYVRKVRIQVMERCISTEK